MTVNFDDLFDQAWRIEISGQVTEAIAAYRDIAEISKEDYERPHHLRAILGAGRSAAMAVSPETASYYRDSLALLAEALKEALQLQDQVTLGVTYREMARAADAEGDFANAAVFFQKSLETLEKNEAISELAATYAGLGSHLGRLGKSDGAIKLLEKAFELFSKEPLSGFYQARARTDFAILYIRSNDFENAKRYLEESISWFEADHGQERYNFELARAYRVMAVVEMKLGNTKSLENYRDKSARAIKTLDPLAASHINSYLKSLGHA